MVAIKLCCCSYVVVFCCLFGARFDCKTDIKNQVWNRIPPDQMMHGQHNGAIGRGQLRSAHDAGSVGHPNKVRDMVSCP